MTDQTYRKKLKRRASRRFSRQREAAWRHQQQVRSVRRSADDELRRELADAAEAELLEQECRRWGLSI